MKEPCKDLADSCVDCGVRRHLASQSGAQESLGQVSDRSLSGQVFDRSVSGEEGIFGSVYGSLVSSHVLVLVFLFVLVLV